MAAQTGLCRAESGTPESVFSHRSSNEKSGLPVHLSVSVIQYPESRTKMSYVTVISADMKFFQSDHLIVLS